MKNMIDPDTYYSLDEIDTYVSDASLESLRTVNLIPCLMKQTRAFVGAIPCGRP